MSVILLLALLAALLGATPTMTLAPTSGTAGSNLTISGTKFPHQATVTLTWDGAGFKTTTSRPSGSWSVSATVPQAAAGNHTVTATSNGVTLSRSFQVVGLPATTTFTPTVIPLGTEPDITNPYRGLHAVNGYIDPPNWPWIDDYSRDDLFWYELEPSQGVYDFSRIDAHLARAQSHGGKFGFRIMAAMCSEIGDGRAGLPYVPQYLWNLMPHAYVYTANCGTSRATAMPDFDDPNFLARAQALIQALGARYANDPRLGWVEASFMGMWGEWHVYDAPYKTRVDNAGNIAWTVAHGEQIINWWHQYLPKTRLIVMTPDFEVMDYALGLDSRIGWRNDCVGDYWLDEGLRVNTGYQHHLDQWKTAPIYFEPCAGTWTEQRGHDQIIRYHFAAGHTAGLRAYSTLSSSDQALRREMLELAGYRFQLNSLTLPTLTSGQSFTVNSRWSNVGLTPAYTAWQPRLQLRDPGTGSVVWQGASSLNLDVLLPTTQFAQSDTFTLSAPAGTYDVVVKIADPAGYYAPLGLAIQGRQSDGSYKLGTISVH